MLPSNSSLLVTPQIIQFIKGKLFGLILFIIVTIGMIGCTPITGTNMLESTVSPQSQDSTPAASLETEPSIYLPTQVPVEGERVVMEALIIGELVVVDQCIRVITEYSKPDNSFLAIWPPHFTVNTTVEPAQIIDESGEVVARIGDVVQMGGGEVKGYADPEVTGSLPPECLGGISWIVGEGIEVIERE